MSPAEAYRAALALLNAADGWLPVTGTSMAPLLQPGDAVQVAPLRPTWQPGEIVVFAHETHLTTHRLLHHYPHSLPPQCQTQGDNTWHPDPPWPASVCVGRVVTVRRKNQRLKLDTTYWHTLGYVLALTMRVAHAAQGLRFAPARLLTYPLARLVWRSLRGLCRWSA